MVKTSTPLTIEYRLAWALLWIGVVVFVFALLWGMLNPHIHSMRDTGGKITNSTAGESQAAQDGWWAVITAWELAPLWVALGLVYYGYNRAISESNRTPSR